MPLINHFLARLDLDARLDRFVPTLDRRVRVPYCKALGVLLRSILVEREPIHGQQELVSELAPECFGLEPDEAASIGDDAIGRALDHLFDADRGCHLTDAVVAATREGWPVIWLRSDLLALRQERQRRERLARAQQQAEDLRAKLLGPRSRLRSRAAVAERVDEILSTTSVPQYLTVRPRQLEEHTFKQTKRGRSGPRTTYVRKTRKRWTIEWTVNQPAVDYDSNSDGMYPLLTNDRALSDAEVFEAHKRQPTIEKRFQQTKSVLEIAPVFLKNEARIEAFFFVYFLALLTHALIERELRRSMAASGVDELPLYPEERTTGRPTVDQILRLFSSAHRHALCQDQTPVRVFPPELSALQPQVLSLLAVPPHAFRRHRLPAHNS